MNPRFYSRLAAIIFVVIALVQLLRVLFAWEVTLNGVAIPLFVSGIACFFAAAMAWLGFSASLSQVLMSDSHLKKAQTKLEARNRTQAACEALRRQLIP